MNRTSLHDVVFCIPHGATARTTRNGCLCSSNANRSMSDLHSSCTGIPDGAVHKRQEIEDLSLVASGLHDVDTELLLLCFFRQRAGRPRMCIYLFQPERSRKRNGCRRQHRAAMSGSQRNLTSLLDVVEQDPKQEQASHCRDLAERLALRQPLCEVSAVICDSRRMGAGGTSGQGRRSLPWPDVPHTIQRAGGPRMYISFFQPEEHRNRNGCRRQHGPAMWRVCGELVCFG